MNFASLVGHNSVREAVMGTARRAPTAAELARMEALVAQAMADGAVGFSTGLQYVPGTYAAQDEIVALARVAAKAGGVYASHMRNEGTEIEAAVAEALAVGDQAGIAVQVSHLKIDAPSRWGASEKALAMIDAARARGMRVIADQLPLRCRQLDARHPLSRPGRSKAARRRSSSGSTIRRRGRRSRRRCGG